MRDSTGVPPPLSDEDQMVTLLGILDQLPLKFLKYRVMVDLALATGLRRGELMGLEWKDIDIDNCTLEVRQASQYLPGKGCFVKDPKNESSKRLISVPVNSIARIRKVDTNGIITTVAGNGSTTASGQESAIFTVGQKSYTLGERSFAMDAPPLVSNGCTLVPVRFLAYALGARTSWDPSARQVTITRDTNGYDVVELTMTIGSIAMGSLSVNGNACGTYKTFQMNVAPVIMNGRTYLPASYVAEAFGFKVSWDAAAQTITVSQQST